MLNYMPAPEVATLAMSLIEKYHQHLTNAKIAYVFKKGTWNKNGKEVLGSAKKCSEKDKILHNYDFIITINYEAWARASKIKRQAILDHELNHCGVNEYGEYIFVPHDLEDFASVIRRHGLYKDDVRTFAMTLKQVSLFDEDEKKFEVINCGGLS